MKHVSFHSVLLLVQIYLVSELESRNITGNGSQAGHLIKTKSGKVFLQHSRKKAISSKKDTTYGGQDYSNDDEIQVTIQVKYFLLFLIFFQIFDFCQQKLTQAREALVGFAMFFLRRAQLWMSQRNVVYTVSSVPAWVKICANVTKMKSRVDG